MDSADPSLDELIKTALTESIGIERYLSMIKAQYPIIDLYPIKNSLIQINTALIKAQEKESKLPGKQVPPN